MSSFVDLPINIVIQPHNYELNVAKVTRAYERDEILVIKWLVIAIFIFIGLIYKD